MRWYHRTRLLFFLVAIMTAAPAAFGQITATPSSLQFDWIQGTNFPGPKTVDLTASQTTSFSAHSDSSTWLSVSPSSGSTPRTLTISVSPQNLAPNQTFIGHIIVTPSVSDGPSSVTPTSITVRLTITRPNCSYTLSPSAVSLSSAGVSDATFAVSAPEGCSWSAINTVTWLTGSGSGVGPGTTTYQVAANTGTEPRTATIRVGAFGVFSNFTVTQQAPASCTFTLNPASASAPAAGGGGNFAITASASNCSWSASSNASWLTTSSSGTGSGTVSYSAAANSTGQQRSGTITAGGQTFTVTQPAQSSCTITLNPTSASVAATAGSGTAAVTITGSNCTWGASSNASWLTTSSSGTGSGTLNYSRSANTGSQSRTGTITITVHGESGNTTAVFTVTQAGGEGCTFTLSSNGRTIASQGGDGSFTVNPSSSDCGWTVSTNVPWISASRSGSVVNYSVSANTSTDQRVGVITAAGLSFQITQVGTSGTLTASPSTVSIQYVTGATAPSPRSVTISASSGAVAFTTSASSTGDWLSVTPNGGTTAATLSVATNPISLPPGSYSGTVTVTPVGSGSPLSIVVNLTVQLPSTAPLLSLYPEQISFSLADAGATADNQFLSVFTGFPVVKFTATGSTGQGNWLEVSPTTGVTPGAVGVKVNAAGLQPGDYTGNIRIQAQGTMPAAIDVPVNLHIDAPLPPKLSLTPPETRLALAHNTTKETHELLISNDGSGALNFQAELRIQSGSDWISLESTSGTAFRNQPAGLRFSVDPSAVEPGTYRAEIRVTGAGSTETSSVFLAVNPSGKSILVTQTGLTFVASQGVAPPSQDFAILNRGAGSFDWRLETTTLSGGSWLKVTPGSGVATAGAQENPRVTVSVDAVGLAPGAYYGSVRVLADQAANTPQVVSVVLVVPVVGQEPAPLTSVSGVLLELIRGEPEPSQRFSITNIANRPIECVGTLTADRPERWYNGPERALLPIGPVNPSVTGKLSGLPAGTYKGMIALSFPNGGLRTIEVRSIVTEPSGATSSKGERLQNANCSPTKLVPVIESPQLQDGFVVQALQPVSVDVRVADNCGNPILPDAVMVAKITPGNVTLPLSHKGGGVWSGKWDPSNNGLGAAEVKIAALKLLAGGGVLAPDSEVRRRGQVVSGAGAQASTVLNSASFTEPRQVALGSWVSIFGEGLATEQAQASGTYPTQLGGTEVRIGDSALPLQFVSDQQVNALIPGNLEPYTQLQLRIQRGEVASGGLDVVVAETQPAIYTTSQTGQGQGAILTQDNLLAAPSGIVPGSKPAPRGTVIQIFASGLGRVSNPPPPGEPAPTTPPLSQTQSQPTVSIGGVDAPVQFSGLAPGFVGLYQVNALVDQSTPTGNAVPLKITINGVESNEVTVAIE